MINPHAYSAIMSSPLGHIGVIIKDQQLSRLDVLDDSAPIKVARDPLSKLVCDELAAYFNQPEYSFQVSIQLVGTPFQQKVWRAIQAIPVGVTMTYGQLAQQLKSAPRAIGQACRTNAIPIIIPCHRIVAANGIGGYAGATAGKQLDIKKWLLNHEHNSSRV